ncbi:MAG: high-affinity nickel-transporter [Anaerolineales bacterium]|nr:high-affinity nickel-transporter [Anaerolineales bacterium]
MKKIRRTSVVILTLLISFIFVPAALAHPLGNFTINQYVGLNVSRDKVLVDYVVDMAEISAFQEIAIFDANKNGLADSSEASGYHVDKCISLQSDLNLFLNNQPAVLTLASSSVEFPIGVGGLSTLRLNCNFEASIISKNEIASISFNNNAFTDRLGWNEIVVIADHISLQGDFATTSLSNRLTDYPQDLLTSPLDQREVGFEITSAGISIQNQSLTVAEQTESPLADRNDAFTRLILLEEINTSTLLFALAISFVWGAMHAMTPGHGKTIVGAYLVGSRGTPRHALYLGLTTTITHTAGVFALGMITLFASQFIVPEKLYPWMNFLSGLFVMGIGVKLLTTRYKTADLGAWFHKLKPTLITPSRLHSPVLQQTHIKGITHQHRYVLNAEHSYYQSHSHGHVHSHDDSHHPHHDHADSHDHGVGDHSHMPPGADDTPVTWRSLLALGISGGLIPCPSALVVLLGAIALNRIGFGLILVFAFSLGLAGALTTIGLMFIYAGRVFERFPSQGKLIHILPVLSALFISLVGLAITLRALTETGIIGS